MLKSAKEYFTYTTTASISVKGNHIQLLTDLLIIWLQSKPAWVGLELTSTG